MNCDLWNVIDSAYIPSNDKSKRNKSEKILFAMNKIVLDILRISFDSKISNRFASFDSAYKLWTYIEAHQKELHGEELQSKKNVDATSREMATTRLRPLGDSPSEVSSESDSEDDMSFDELACGFEKLRHAYNGLKLKHDKLQVDHDALLAKFNDVSNEKLIILHKHDELEKEHEILTSRFNEMCQVRDDAINELTTLHIDYDSLSSKLDSMKNDNTMLSAIRNELVLFKDNHVCSSSSNDVFDQEFKIVKDRMDSLNSTLNVCVHAHKNLENLCVKKNSSISKKHTHHAYLYAKVHKCIICGRKGHLAKFCFDAHKRVKKPVYLAPKNIWVPSVLKKNVFTPQSHTHIPIEYHKHPNVYACTICGRKGHLAEFCFDVKKKSLKNSLFLEKKNFCAHTHVDHMVAQPFHCTHCGRKGHLRDFCFDRLRAINAPSWVHNPKVVGFGVKAHNMFDRVHNPSFLGPKKFWVPKTF
jgi:hypothetical protein